MASSLVEGTPPVSSVVREPAAVWRAFSPSTSSSSPQREVAAREFVKVIDRGTEIIEGYIRLGLLFVTVWPASVAVKLLASREPQL
jgi:hypothetical protein